MIGAIEVLPSFAKPDDREAMKSLWMEAFGDDESEVDAFFDRFFSPKTALVMRDARRVVSMLFLLPATVKLPLESRLVGYIYGGATCVQERGKGYYRRLLLFAQEVAKENGMKALFLHPADALLDESYQRLGFSVPLYADESKNVSVSVSDNVTELSAKEYVQCRRSLLQNGSMAYIDWDDAVFEHCASWCRTYRVGDAACVLIAVDGSYVYEYIGDTETAVSLPKQICEKSLRCRTVGTKTVVGRLLTLDDAAWDVPVYMGYGME